MNKTTLLKKPLTGVIVPLITPYRSDGSIHTQELNNRIDRLISAGVDALMVAGTTGEAPLLSLEERQQLAENVIQHTAGRVPVAVQVGTAATRESIHLARHAVHHGASAISVLCPYYFSLPDSALIEHFCQVANAVPQDFPVYLYNFPQRTGNNISPAVSQAVADRCPNVVGEKDSSGDLNLFVAKRPVRSGNFDLLIGSDALVLPALALGARGTVAGVANVFPELFTALLQAYRRSDLPAAEQAQARIHLATSTFNGSIALMKAVLVAQGIPVGNARLPLAPPSPADVQACLTRLREAGLRLPEK